MPNTDPINDHASVTQFIEARGRSESRACVCPIGAVTIGSRRAAHRDRRLVRFRLCRDHRRRQTDRDGAPDAAARSSASMFGKLVIDHCEDPSL
jgi:dihydroorotase-like cyclic amidohydrolase